MGHAGGRPRPCRDRVRRGRPRGLGRGQRGGPFVAWEGADDVGRSRLTTILAATLAALVVVGLRRELDPRRCRARRSSRRAAMAHPARSRQVVTRAPRVRAAARAGGSPSSRSSRSPLLGPARRLARARRGRRASSLASTSSYALVPEKGLVHVTVDVTADEQQAEPGPADAERHADDALLLRRGGDRRPRRGDRRSGRRRARRRSTTKVTAGDGFTVAPGRLPGRPPRTSRSTGFRSTSTCPAGAALRQRHPGRVGVRDVLRLGVRRPRRRQDRHPGRIRGRDQRLDRSRETVEDGVTTLDRDRDRDATELVRGRRRRPPRRPHAGTGSTSPAASTSSIRAWPEDDEWRTRVRDLLEIGLPVLVEQDRARLAGRGRHRGRRGPHAAARGLRRGLLHGRGPDRDQRGPRRADDRPRGVARLVQRRPLRRALDQRGLRRRVRRRGSSTRSPTAGSGPTRSSPTADGRGRAERLAASRPDRRRRDGRTASTYGYEASWTVVRALVWTRSARTAMREVLAAATQAQTAYVGAAEPETVTITNDWRRFLDLLEEAGGSTARGRCSGSWVVSTEQEALLDARARRAAAYAALVEAGDGWLPGYVGPRPDGPLGVRPGARRRSTRRPGSSTLRDEIAAPRRELGVDAADLAARRPTRARRTTSTTRPRPGRRRSSRRSTDARRPRPSRRRRARRRSPSIGLIGEDPGAAGPAATAAFAARRSRRRRRGRATR